ncbi:uncharacterized protein PAC_14438 [Phialocephala subalpina]|uniref:Uncharacterized protein n=1 Tax=Phialocephala subalpina TaxID=576137 RepID=A0A1L7XHM1_9HELO|nr:uncharacterized protein PAC_14438 [Phialocephala subalpina]
MGIRSIQRRLAISDGGGNSELHHSLTLTTNSASFPNNTTQHNISSPPYHPVKTRQWTRNAFVPPKTPDGRELDDAKSGKGVDSRVGRLTLPRRAPVPTSRAKPDDHDDDLCSNLSSVASTRPPTVRTSKAELRRESRKSLDHSNAPTRPRHAPAAPVAPLLGGGPVFEWGIPRPSTDTADTDIFGGLKQPQASSDIFGGPKRPQVDSDIFGGLRPPQKLADAMEGVEETGDTDQFGRLQHPTNYPTSSSNDKPVGNAMPTDFCKDNMDLFPHDITGLPLDPDQCINCGEQDHDESQCQQTCASSSRATPYTNAPRSVSIHHASNNTRLCNAQFDAACAAPSTTRAGNVQIRVASVVEAITSNHHGRLSGCNTTVLPDGFKEPVPGTEATTWPRGRFPMLWSVLSAYADDPAYRDLLKDKVAAAGGYRAYIQQQLAELQRSA